MAAPTVLFFSALPFIATFVIVAVAVSTRLFPLLSGHAHKPQHDSAHLPGYSPRERRVLFKRIRITARGLSSLAFATNIGLSAVLVELILCEISNTVNHATRTLALKITLPSLLFVLIFVTPALELHSVISRAGWRFTGGEKRQRRTAWVLEGLGLAGWLGAFWYLGRSVLGEYLHEESYVRDHSLSEGCLERIGIIGISLMASLAGFAAVSSLWQTFGAKHRPVNDSDIARKEAGLQATEDMLLAKSSRLRALERKMSDAPHEGFVTRVVGTLRGNPDTQERAALQLEIQGLEVMRSSLQNSLMLLASRHQTQRRAHTPLGRLLNAFNAVFATYCAYRIAATSLTTLRRLASASASSLGPAMSTHDPSFASTDPINNVLALVAKHWDPTLDRLAWSRTISFLLSGLMLLLSFNSVLQTFYIFARLAPGVLAQARANFALLISQIAAVYVISSALLLRSNLPREMESKVAEALGAPLEVGFTERWFEGWFLCSVGVTAVGIWLGKKVGSGGWEDGEGDYEEEGGWDIEMGKRS